jgi:transcriptional regulator with XRE-family HTH domain
MATARTSQNFHALLGKRLRERRISQARLAKNLGVSENTVSGWTTGSHSPKAKVLPKIARELETSVGELFGEEPPAPPTETEGVSPDSIALGLVRRLARLGLVEQLDELRSIAPELLKILKSAEQFGEQ